MISEDLINLKSPTYKFSNQDDNQEKHIFGNMDQTYEKHTNISSISKTFKK